MCAHVDMNFLFFFFYRGYDCVCKSEIVCEAFQTGALHKHVAVLERLCVCVCVCVIHSHANDCVLVNTMYSDLMVAIKHDKPPVDGWSFSLHINM